MYSREESAKIKTAFWTAYGQYMSPVPSAEGEQINWVNYRTGEKYIQIRTSVEGKEATVAVIFNHPDAGIRELHVEQMEKFKSVFIAEAGDNWIWMKADNEFKIHLTLSGHSIFNREHWPAIISFFKTNMIALDNFWSNVKYAFEELR